MSSYGFCSMMGQINSSTSTRRPPDEKIHIRIRQILKEIDDDIAKVQSQLMTFKAKLPIEQKDVEEMKTTMLTFDERFTDKINYLNFTNQYTQSKMPVHKKDSHNMTCDEVISLLEEECKRWTTLKENILEAKKLDGVSNESLIMELNESKCLFMKINKANIEMLPTNHVVKKEHIPTENKTTHDHCVHSGPSHQICQGNGSQAACECYLQHEQTRSELQTLKTDINSHENGNKSLNKNYECLKQQFSACVENMKMLRAEVAETNDKHQDVNTELAIVKVELKEAKKQILSLTDEKSVMKGKHESLTKAYADEKQRRETTEKLLKKEKESKATLQTVIRSLGAKNDDLLLRLGKIAGEKLTDNNPNVTDLSDRNRPTKLGEMYSELYDNEWTDAFDALKKAGHDDIDIIDALKKTILHTLKFCKEKSSLFMKKINDAVNFNVDEKNGGASASQHKIMSSTMIDGGRQRASGSSGPETQTNAFPSQDVIQIRKLWKPKTSSSKGHPGKQIIESKSAEVKEVNAAVKIQALAKEVAGSMVPILQKEYFDTMWDEHCLPAVRPYIERCLYICWMMVVQSPPMAFAQEPDKGSSIDSNFYKSYLSMGKKVAYVVWPALLLHTDGGLICKGVVEVRKDSK